jgi:hypothetical protein
MSIETLTQTEETEKQEVSAESLEVEAKEESTEAEETEEAVNDGAEEESEEVEEKPKKLSGYKLKAKLAREEAEYWKSKALGAAPQENVIKTDVELVKPDPTKYENQADYIEALTDYKVAKIKKDFESEKAKEGQEQTHKQALASYENRSKEFAKVQTDFTEKIEEFDDENPGFQWTPAMSKLIVDSEVGPAVLYEMAKDHNIAKRLNSLDPLTAAKEFGKLEAKLSTPKTVVKKSTASPPPKPISGTKQEVKKSIYDEDLSPSEYEALRWEQIKAQKRA